MSVRPKYFYDLSIYDPENIPDEHTSPCQRWNISLGLGDQILGAVSSSKTATKKFTNKASDILEYAATREGKLKLGFIASCTCVGGILTLITKPQGRFRKLLYPTGFLGLSTAICYPSNAYSVAKVSALYTYQASAYAGTHLYNGAKFSVTKISSIMEERRIKSELKRAEEEAKRQEEEIMKEETPDIDSAPLRNPPVSDEKIYHVDEENVIVIEEPPEVEPVVSEVEPEPTVIEPVISEAKPDPGFQIFTSKSLMEEKLTSQNKEETENEKVSQEKKDSLLDMGQSSEEDTDMYTTRL